MECSEYFTPAASNRLGVGRVGGSEFEPVFLKMSRVTKVLYQRSFATLDNSSTMQPAEQPGANAQQREQTTAV